jgi:radical SAM superfamily enzyme with C-terminal helix-hairpin-helix motif
MGAAASARLLAIGATWRLTGVNAAGRALVTAVAADRETERTLAGMLLVQAGDRSVPVVTDAILAGPAAAELVNVLASIGSRMARDALARVSRAAPSSVAQDIATAAAEALRTLDRIRPREPGPEP